MSDLRLKHAGRVALGLAKVPARDQAAILDEMERRLDADSAMARRNAALREAFRHLVDVDDFADTLADFYGILWKRLRHLAEPPADAEPLHHSLFLACQAADDSGRAMPGSAGQIRRIVCPPPVKKTDTECEGSGDRQTPAPEAGADSNEWRKYGTQD
jgi:hypothetical protein